MRRLLAEHLGFRLLWSGETTSAFGNSVTTVVMPLIAVSTLHADALTVSLLRAATWLPWLLMGLAAGAWIEVIAARRALMIYCDLAAALVFATVPVAAVLGLLTPLQLIAIALVAGAISVLFNTTYRVFLLEVLTRAGDRPAGNSALQGSASVANVAGPGLGGLLVTIVGSTATMLFDSASFLVSAACLARIHTEPRAPADASSRRALADRIREGMTYVRNEPLLRALTLYGAESNLALSAYQSILIVFLVRETHLSAAAVGVVLALAGLGGVAGAILAGPLARRIGSARALMTATLLGSTSALLIPLASSSSRAGLAVAGGFLVSAGVVANNILQATFAQGYVPEDLFARTTTTISILNYGTIPVGAVLGGVLAQLLGLGSAMWIATGLLPFGYVFLLASPIRELREMPTRDALRTARG